MVVVSEQPQDYNDENVHYHAAIVDDICQRCLSEIKQYWKLPNGKRYCWNCATYGRIDEDKWLKCYAETHDFEMISEDYDTWAGTLTLLQTSVAQSLLTGIQKNKDQLLYAVTGAGKTEMLFPAIKWAIKCRKRIAYVSPRVDVIREIAPRIMAHFKLSYTMMHGEVTDTFAYTQLTFATIHQLYKFYHAFDLIIVDEADAYPLSGNQSLWYVLAQARSDQSVMIYMTATLNQDLKRLMRLGQVQVQNLLQRFHGYQLPNIKISKVMRCWDKCFPIDIVNQFKQKSAPWLIFVPMIDDLDTLKQHLKKLDLSLRIACISSQTNDRETLIQKLKNGEIDVLCTTIILERGVTIADVQIIILGADEGAYSDETLLQIAGRSGRDINFPDGKIIAYCQEDTMQLKRVRGIIDDINRKYNM